jgi:hypothetical protein
MTPWYAKLSRPSWLVGVRSRRRKRTERRVRRSPWSSISVWLRLTLLALIAGLMIAGAVEHHGPATPRQAFAQGLQLISVGLFRPDIYVELIVLLLALVSIRGLVLRFLAFRASSPIEVRPIDNATGNKRLDTHQFDVSFRDYLALSRLYQIPTVPGDQESDRLIDVLSTPTSKGWLGLLSAILAYAFPRRAYIITASLVVRDQNRGRGVSIQVRKYPWLPVHLESQWSTTFDRALQRAAYAVAAHITQQTKACRRVPWSEWARRRRPLPATLFRDYQRAKRMVGERRYDEAIALYNSALRQDADNIAMRYDVGQLYERLGLYPDALLTYLGLVDEIFPARTVRGQPVTPVRRADCGPAASGKIRKYRRNRSKNPTWWPKPRTKNRDPFVIRYRYIIVLGQGDLLAQELVSPEWPELQQRATPPPAHLRASPELDIQERRPWRATELDEIGRLLARRLDSLYSAYCGGKRLEGLLNERGRRDDKALQRDIARYLLSCADYEASTLIRDVRRINWRLRGYRTRKSSFLTPVAVWQSRLMISSRRRRLDGASLSVNSKHWPKVKDIIEDLKQAGYTSDSINWLEHYNTACHYALATLNYADEHLDHPEHACEAINALDRAARYGDQVDFVTSKRYWLQAGDPDLAGLRNYPSFRAFEARVYGHPLPATAELSKYELYRFLRAVVRRAAGSVEGEWRKRAAKPSKDVSHPEFEDWWRRELRAWEVAIRIGRFYRQWQTRHAALEAIREWFESFGPEAPPIPYPNITRGDYLPDIGHYGLVKQMLIDTEKIFTFLATKCGNLITVDADTAQSVYEKTRRWSEYAEARSRSGERLPMNRLAKVCLARAAVWAALRQWAQAPNQEREKILEEAIRELAEPG